MFRVANVLPSLQGIDRSREVGAFQSVFSNSNAEIYTRGNQNGAWYFFCSKKVQFPESLPQTQNSHGWRDALIWQSATANHLLAHLARTNSELELLLR